MPPQTPEFGTCTSLHAHGVCWAQQCITALMCWWCAQRLTRPGLSCFFLCCSLACVCLCIVPGRCLAMDMWAYRSTAALHSWLAYSMGLPTSHPHTVPKPFLPWQRCRWSTPPKLLAHSTWNVRRTIAAALCQVVQSWSSGGTPAVPTDRWW